MKTKFAVAKKNPLIPTLYVANISYKLTEEGLDKFLNRYGKVTYMYLVRDKKTKKSKGVAFVQYAKKEEFYNALKALDGKPFMERTLKASQAIENESMPMKPKTKDARVLEEKLEVPKKRKQKKGLDLLREVTGNR
jgi:RNA recognition motif-containing protein